MINNEIIQAIKAETERRKMEAIGFRNAEKREDWASFFNGEATALENLLSFLNTLESEKPMNQEGLDQEIIKCWQEWVSPSNKQSVEGVLPLSEFAFYARHFAKWGAEHLKK
ncbi:MAG: hypothetical protein J6U54_15030 [Clostridiales bacterium]|nr:hypothetical protein [Clostridiales bacterium]